MITVTIYPAKGLLRRKQWRWTARAANSEIIATSGGETYHNKSDLLDTLNLLFSNNIGVQVKDGTGGLRRIR